MEQKQDKPTPVFLYVCRKQTNVVLISSGITGIMLLNTAARWDAKITVYPPASPDKVYIYLNLASTRFFFKVTDSRLDCTLSTSYYYSLFLFPR